MFTWVWMNWLLLINYYVDCSWLSSIFVVKAHVLKETELFISKPGFLKNLLKCALQNQSLKAHYKAGNIFVRFFICNDGQRLSGAAGARTPDPQIFSLMVWPLGHGNQKHYIACHQHLEIHYLWTNIVNWIIIGPSYLLLWGILKVPLPLNKENQDN